MFDVLDLFVEMVVGVCIDCIGKVIGVIVQLEVVGGLVCVYVGVVIVLLVVLDIVVEYCGEFVQFVFVQVLVQCLIYELFMVGVYVDLEVVFVGVQQWIVEVCVYCVGGVGKVQWFEFVVDVVMQL